VNLVALFDWWFVVGLLVAIFALLGHWLEQLGEKQEQAGQKPGPRAKPGAEPFEDFLQRDREVRPRTGQGAPGRAAAPAAEPMARVGPVERRVGQGPRAAVPTPPVARPKAAEARRAAAPPRKPGAPRRQLGGPLPKVEAALPTLESTVERALVPTEEPARHVSAPEAAPPARRNHPADEARLLLMGNNFPKLAALVVASELLRPPVGLRGCANWHPTLPSRYPLLPPVSLRMW
jgi:hypothetical protein